MRLLGWRLPRDKTLVALSKISSPSDNALGTTILYADSIDACLRMKGVAVNYGHAGVLGDRGAGLIINQGTIDITGTLAIIGK